MNTQLFGQDALSLLLGVLIISIALTRIVHHAFYYRHEAKRQIGLANAKGVRDSEQVRPNGKPKSTLGKS